MSLNREQQDILIGLVFGSIIRHIREQRNQTRTPFAALLGLSADELQWIEDGSDSSITAMYHVSEGLGISCARIAAAMQLVTKVLENNPEIEVLIRKKDWNKVNVLVLAELTKQLDLLKLSRVHTAAVAEQAVQPIPKVSPELYRVQPLTPVRDATSKLDDFEPEPEPVDVDEVDDDTDDDDPDGDPDEFVDEPARHTRTSSHTNPRKIPSPNVEVAVKPGNNSSAPGVQRRGPGRPRKYPVPPAT